jgi:hypothetical protein
VVSKGVVCRAVRVNVWFVLATAFCGLQGAAHTVPPPITGRKKGLSAPTWKYLVGAGNCGCTAGSGVPHVPDATRAATASGPHAIFAMARFQRVSLRGVFLSVNRARATKDAPTLWRRKNYAFFSFK